MSVAVVGCVSVVSCLTITRLLKFSSWNAVGVGMRNNNNDDDDDVNDNYDIEFPLDDLEHFHHIDKVHSHCRRENQ